MKNWMLTTLLTSALVLGGTAACDSDAASSGGDGDGAPSGDGDGGEDMPGYGDGDRDGDGDADPSVPGDGDGAGGSLSLGGSDGLGSMGGSPDSGLDYFEDFESGLDAWATDGDFSGGPVTLTTEDGNSAATLSTRLGTCESSSLERTIEIPEGVIVMWFEVSGANTNGSTQSWLSLGDWVIDLPEVDGTTEVVPACLPSGYAGTGRLGRFVLRSTDDCAENALHIDNIRFGNEKIKCDRFSPND